MSSTFNVDSALISVTFDMLASPGGISIPGLEVGDVMLSLSSVNTSSPNGNASFMGSGFFEAIVSVADEIQQNVSTSPAGNTFTAVFFRGP